MAPQRQVSEHFPLDIRLALVDAAAIQDEDERRRAIDSIIDRARRRYPKLFQVNQ